MTIIHDLHIHLFSTIVVVKYSYCCTVFGQRTVATSARLMSTPKVRVVYVIFENTKNDDIS